VYNPFLHYIFIINAFLKDFFFFIYKKQQKITSNKNKSMIIDYFLMHKIKITFRVNKQIFINKI